MEGRRSNVKLWIGTLLILLGQMLGGGEGVPPPPGPHNHFSSSSNVNLFDRIIVFGDSYSDIGNVWNLTNQSWPFPQNYQGRFCNGHIWVEYLAENIGASLEDWAYGGATVDSNLNQGYTGFSSSIPVPGVAQQVNLYLNSNPPATNDLFIFALEGNDYYFNNQTDPHAVVNNLFQSVQKIIAARKPAYVFISTIPKIGVLPYYQRTNYASQMNAISQQHNAILAGHVDAFRKNQTTTEILYWHFDLLVQAVLWNPIALDFFDSTDPCFVVVNNQTATVCSSPDSYLFWDDFHFSNRFHQMMGNFSSALVTSQVSSAVELLPHFLISGILVLMIAALKL